MRAPIVRVIVALLLLGSVHVAWGDDNLLKNSDFKEGSQLWRGDAQEAYLKPDGTEGTEFDKDAVPVLRISLSRGLRRDVNQEFRMNGAPNILHIKIQVYASIDFKRSAHAEDYAADDITTPNADFSCFMLPDYSEETAELKPGEWTTVKWNVSVSQAAEERVIHFLIPPGQGVVYIKNPSVTP